MANLWVSWNKNVKHAYEQLVAVNTESQLVKAVKESSSIRVVGHGFSSADICAGTDTLLDLSNYNKIVSVNRATKEITVQAGVILKDMLNVIQASGWSLPCLPDIDTISVGGALATGTHGTSGHILSYYVTKFRVVLANGTVVDMAKDHPQLGAMLVSVGVLGIFSEITFQCEDLYLLEIDEFYQKDEDWLNNLQNYLTTYAFVRILWLPHTDSGYVILGNKVDSKETIVEIKPPFYIQYRRSFSNFLYKISGVFPGFTVRANKILKSLFFKHTVKKVGSLYDATVTKKRGSTMELAEWVVSYKNFKSLFVDLKEILNDKNQKVYAHIPMDIRFLKADGSWIGNAGAEGVVTIGCVSRNAKKANEHKAFDTIEQLFLKYQGKPHWGKRHQLGFDDFEKLYPKWTDFTSLRAKLDPSNKFLSPYLKKIFVKTTHE